MNATSPQLPGNEWVEFPGGELEGQRPKALCPACRKKLNARVLLAPESRRRRPVPLCFQCYRADLERQSALKAAGDLDTASEQRFQTALPFEPVNQARLERLRADRAAARAAMQSGPDRFVDKRRHAQIAARHALQRIAAGLSGHATAEREPSTVRAFADLVHAAELQLPEAWLPFVVSR